MNSQIQTFKKFYNSDGTPRAWFRRRLAEVGFPYRGAVVGRAFDSAPDGYVAQSRDIEHRRPSTRIEDGLHRSESGRGGARATDAQRMEATYRRLFAAGGKSTNTPAADAATSMADRWGTPVSAYSLPTFRL